MAVYYGLCENCYWSYHTGQSTDDDWDLFLSTSGEAVNNLGVRAMITVTFRSIPPSAPQRRKLANQIRAGAYPERHALVTASPLVRGVLTALSWMSRRTYDEQVFAHPVAAASWVCEIADCSALDVVSAVRAKVPTLQLDPRLRQANAG